MSEVLWYYEEDGKQAGPISQAAISDAIRGGRLPAGRRVWRAGLTGWLPWESVPELAVLAPAAPPSPGAPPPPAGPGWGTPPAGQAQGWGPPPGGAAASPLGPLYPKAPLGSRFVAYVIDSLIGFTPLVVVGVGLAIAASREATALTVVFGLLAAAALAWGLWYAFTKDGRPNGQSIGKKAQGLMVVHLPTNQPCTPGQSALRALVLHALGLVPYVGGFVEPIVTLVAEGGRRLGDKAAGTQVIAVGDYRPRR